MMSYLVNLIGSITEIIETEKDERAQGCWYGNAELFMSLSSSARRGR